MSASSFCITNISIYNFHLITVCESPRLVDSSNGYENFKETNTIITKSLDSGSQITTILDPRNLTVELLDDCPSDNENSQTSDSADEQSSHDDASERQLLIKPQEEPVTRATMDKVPPVSNTNDSKKDSNCLRPPGLMIPKVGYFGLSEGNIPLALSKAESEESINRILSEESLLGDYLRDMSLLTSLKKVRCVENWQDLLFSIDCNKG